MAIGRFEKVSDDLGFALEIAVNECVHNIDDHSLSPIGGVGCAQYFPETREIRVAMADWGQGIGASLKKTHPEITSDEQALRRALFGGYSAKSRPYNQGRGLDNLRSVVADAFRGDLFIFSGAGSAEFVGNWPPRFHAELQPFQGTIVCFTLPMRPREPLQ